ECWAALAASATLERLAPRSRALLKKVLLGDNGIRTRHFVFDSLAEAFDLTPDAMQARFAAHAPALAAQAARRAIAAAAVDAAAVDAVIASTCTGYLCPGLSSYLAEDLGLRAGVLPLDLVGQGCAAALPNLRAAEALMASGHYANVLSVCVEICSAAFYLDDDPGTLISACIFGDGAGAALLSATPPEAGRRIEWRGAASLLRPEDRDCLRFEHAGGMLRNVLTPEVPELAAAAVAHLLPEVLAQTGVTRREISAWLWHAGGRDVLLAIRRRLALEDTATALSAEVLAEIGNTSSAFVYHVLHRALARDLPGGSWWMSSFGAGFSCHGAILAVE
ncbi:MAG: stilbene synthase, partial [Planctomycetes bacterium]|nr:stilbene synthase [Planctomycetota bacterium]